MLDELLGTFNLSTWFIQRIVKTNILVIILVIISMPLHLSHPHQTAGVQWRNCTALAAAGCPACAAAAADDRQRPILQPFGEVVFLSEIQMTKTEIQLRTIEIQLRNKEIQLRNIEIQLRNTEIQVEQFPNTIYGS